MVTVIQIPPAYMSAVECSWRLGRRHVTSTNPWTRNLRAGGATDERWIVEITLPAGFRRAALDEFEAIFDQGDGLAGHYSAFDAVHAAPRGGAAGASGYSGSFSDGTFFSDGTGFADAGLSTCTTGAAAARGARYVTLTGLEENQSLGFARGDMIAITQDGEDYGFLHKVIADVATDGSGSASVHIAPRLREPVAAGQLVRLRHARGVFMLASEDVGAVTRGPGGFGQPALQLIEAPEALTLAAFV